MKLILLMVWSLLALATSKAGQMNFSLEPQTPTSNDEVQFTISQEFDSTCYKSTASFERIGKTINVEILSEGLAEICLPVLFPQSVTVNLGDLKAGTYRVNVNWSGAPSWGSRSGKHSFEVTASVPNLRLFMLEPIGLRFETEVDAKYQVEWSAELDSWFDLGGVIAGDGGEMVVHDIMQQGPRRFYRVKLAAKSIRPPEDHGILP